MHLRVCTRGEDMWNGVYECKVIGVGYDVGSVSILETEGKSHPKEGVVAVPEE